MLYKVKYIVITIGLCVLYYGWESNNIDKYIEQVVNAPQFIIKKIGT